MVFFEIGSDFKGACCENLLVKSTSEDFPHKECIGHFSLYLDIEGDPMVCYGASVFRNEETKTYLYRSKYGNWVIGKTLGKMKKGALVRSHEEDRESFTHVCPCKVDKWQVRNNQSWHSDDSIRVMIRRNKVVF